MIDRIQSRPPVHRCSHGHVHQAVQPQAETSLPTDNVALGVLDVRSQKKVAFNTAQAAMWSVDAAVQAASHGTFGVGGVLLGPHKELLAVSCNRVIADGKVADPTAHGERQIVDWYFEKVAQGEQLPAPAECTIVSSLDPCVMCAGAILTGGFNVVSTTLDTRAGVNWTADAQYPSIPEGLRSQAQQHFAYFGVEGARGYQGPDVLGEHQVLTSDVEKRSLDTFLGSLAKVQETIHSGPSQTVQDLGHCQDAQVLSSLHKYCPEALSLKFPAGRPDQALAEPLLQAAEASKSRGGAYDAAALLDPHGNLVMLTGGREDRSPTRTAFMELTRKWAKVRAEAGPEGEKFLAPLKDCTLVTLFGPGSDSQSLMTLGAYGSSVEGALPAHETPAWQYVVPSQNQADLEREIASLPPLYSQVIRPQIQQVSDAGLVHSVTHHEH
jgi:tRNA(Arg) A34 adenosine deaminase TadA